MNKLHLLLLLIVCFLYIPEIKADDYRTQAQEIRQEVWGWNLPAFQQYEVPEAYRNESAVVLTRHKRIEASGKKFSFAKAFFTGSMAGKVFYTNVDRSLVKINDQAALDDFSDLAYKEMTKQRNLGNTNLFKTFVGARIIKPGGEIIEVDVDMDAVAVVEGKKEETAYKKLAIPNLQVGDILDYFFYNVYTLETLNIADQSIPFYTIDYPALHYSVYCEFGKNVTVEYRSINGAPGLEEGSDSEGNVVLTGETTDILRINEVENLRWLSVYRDLPLIRFSILQNASKVIYRPPSARPIGVHKDVPEASILADANSYLAPMKFRAKSVFTKTEKIYIREAVDNYKLQNPQLNADDFAVFIAALHGFYWRNGHEYYYNSGTYCISLHELLKENGLETKIGFTTNQLGARREELFDSNDLFYFVTANNEKQLFLPWHRLRVAGEIPGEYEGEKASLLDVTKYKANTILGTTSEFTIPSSTMEENLNTTRLSVSFSEVDPTKLILRRHTIWSGEVKREMQGNLYLFEDWDREMRQYLGINRTYIEELEKHKQTRKQVEEVIATLERQREEQEEQMKTEITMHHGIVPGEVTAYTLHHLGVTPLAPHLEYEATYSLEGLVKKACNNLILEIGKLIGAQWKPTPEERKRNIDAYLSAVRSFDNEITIEIPEGYELLATDQAFSWQVDNAYGSFEASVSQEGNNLLLKTRKCYKKSFIPSADFDYLLEMIDLTNEFAASVVVFRPVEESDPE
ncbi:DUF3857 domain-containing protein [Parabacteroides sp. OttesenSCG-928-G06]|nr:DUF3857 domain-containing protein [Parabacteroides sp. OttesenSCG-928-K15]MDL2282556.1 DUF3857 domain-containing protein [Parabacteroides sp. OttesenSCG-928-G06]